MVVNLRIQDKKEKDLLTLKVITEKEKFPELVEKKDAKLTLISEEKTYYLYLKGSFFVSRTFYLLFILSFFIFNII